MEEGQKINCTVSSCKYNDKQDHQCILQAIQVAPIEGKNTAKADEFAHLRATKSRSTEFSIWIQAAPDQPPLIVQEAF